jgi:dTDP-4-amino-4,6-dideoxygalactose transaminase
MKLNLDGHKRNRKKILKAIKAVVDSEHYIRGPQWEAFNTEWALACRVKHCVGVNSGSDALYLVLKAAGIGPGDEVIGPAHNAAYAALATHLTGATPTFADVDERTMTLDPVSVELHITPRTRAVIPVHLYGHLAAVEPLREVCNAHGLFMLEDAAQAHMAGYYGTRAGQWGNAAAFSFYPTKNMGALGDGGAVVTNDDQLAERMLRMADSGRTERYTHGETGINSNLDELQAAILRIKLDDLAPSIVRRRKLAMNYDALLKGVTIPEELDHYHHTYHLYAIRHPRRDALLQHLNDQDIPALVHYPTPVHLQPCFRHLGGRLGQFPVSEQIARTVLSLPLHPELSEDDQLYVIDTVNAFTAQ